MMALAILAAAGASEFRVLHPGETVEDVAAWMGDAALADAIRSLNGVEAGAQPAPGALLELPPRGGATQERPAHVVALTGGGTLAVPGQEPAPLRAGADAPPGATVCTDALSFATVRLAVTPERFEHDDITLLPGTCLTVTSTYAHAGGRSSVVEVERGGVSVRRADDGDVGAVSVVTSDGLSTGLGGGFRVTVEEDASRTEAVSAPVKVFSEEEVVELSVGEGARVRQDEAPEVVALLGVSGLLTPTDGASLRAAAFSWAPVDRALTYRVEISARPDFTELLAREELTDTTWRPEYLFLPFRVPGLWWRVTAVDRTGFEGLPAEARALAFPAGVGP